MMEWIDDTLYVLGLNVYISHFVVLFLGFEDEKNGGHFFSIQRLKEGDSTWLS